MANQPINLGTAPLGEVGDTVRQAFTKVNANADELYAASDAAATKLATIATGATANATDAQLRDRATHTGTQAISTVSGLQAALGGKQPSNDNLTAFAGLTGAADRLPYFTGAGALSLAVLTGLARNLLDDTTQSGMQSTLGLVKQTSATDTTDGALMAVGAFGLGGVDLPDLTDLDNRLIRPGFYNCAEATGAPSVYGVVHIVGRANGLPAGAWVHQVFYDAINNGAVYERYSTNLQAWSPWRLMYHSGNILGTVSQSGGVPTGAIIERGSNANGEYVRYADGTQICTRLVLISAPDGAASTTIDTTWTYPAVFISIPNVSLSGMARVSTGAIVEGVSSGSVGITTATHTTRSVHASVALVDTWRDSRIAIGRWF